MLWDSHEVPPAAVAQGAVEGCVLGLLYGLVLSITAAASARLRCPASLMLATALRTVPIAMACWALGGLGGVAFAAADPHGFRSMFVPGGGVPLTDWLLKYAWVGGSIWGAYGGAGVGAIYASIRLHRQWQAHLEAERTGFPVSPLVRPIAASEFAPWDDRTFQKEPRP